MLDFMQDYLHALRYLQDPAHHAETVALIAQVTKQKPALFEGWAFTKREPLVVAEIELAQIPLQMLAADVVVGAVDTFFKSKK